MVTRLAKAWAPALLCTTIAACGAKGDLVLPKGVVAAPAQQLPRSPAPVETGPPASVPQR